jgi:hypothetical protein
MTAYSTTTRKNNLKHCLNRYGLMGFPFMVVNNFTYLHRYVTGASSYHLQNDMSNPLQRHDYRKDHHVGDALVLVSSHGNPRFKINEESGTTAEILYERPTQVVSSDDHLVRS